MTVSLITLEEISGTISTLPASALAGTIVSSLHRLKDVQNNEGAFFVFGDLAVKVEGLGRLQVCLYEMRRSDAIYIKSITSADFTVYPSKAWPGNTESTALTRLFSEQGVRLRLRKEPRTLLKKRGPASDDYHPRHYNRTGGSRQQSHGDRAERQSLRSEASQQSQVEQQTSMQSLHLQTDSLESPAQSQSFDQRPSTGRSFSQPSSSFGEHYTEEPAFKRPRTGTGSEQGQPQAFGQAQQSSESSGFSGRMYSDPQQSHYAYAQPTAQPPTYGYPYTQSPQAANPSPHDQFYSGRFTPQGGAGPSFHTGGQRSAATYFGAPQQTQYQPVGQTYGMTTLNQPRMHGGMDHPIPHRMSDPSQMYGRPSPSPSYSQMGIPADDRRQSYEPFANPSPNLGTGMGMNILTSGPSSGMPPTSAAGFDDPNYQQ